MRSVQTSAGSHTSIELSEFEFFPSSCAIDFPQLSAAPYRRLIISKRGSWLFVFRKLNLPERSGVSRKGRGLNKSCHGFISRSLVLLKGLLRWQRSHTEVSIWPEYLTIFPFLWEVCKLSPAVILQNKRELEICIGAHKTQRSDRLLCASTQRYLLSVNRNYDETVVNREP